ncbi:MAG: DUF4249 domain-containing protein [Lewinellaceae bacterium]|nr:DUF4249 domain-containing protein [Lewinellaceae bacterium]
MSIKSISRFFFFAVLGLLFASCEKVIDVDLNSADPKTVIEANLQEGEHLFEVRVYQTKGYFSDMPTVFFDDATVMLTDDSGNLSACPAIGAGRYAAQVNAVAGKTYTLQVVHAGETFTASSELPERTEIEHLSYREINLPGEDEKTQEVFLHFTDRADEHNFYRIMVSSNDSLEQELQYFDDKYINGNQTKWDLFNLYKKGDQLQIELRSIDEAAFDFYKTLAPIFSEMTMWRLVIRSAIGKAALWVILLLTTRVG